MDKDFQTSFIPKKSLTEDRVQKDHPVSIVSFIATIVFFASLISSGGIYFYKIVLTKQVADMKVSIDKYKQAFESGVIFDMKTLDRRLTASQEILNNHITVSPIFLALQDLTLKSVRFSKFEYSFASDDSASVIVRMNGTALSYQSIALQSDMLSKNSNIKDPIFSNLNLDAATGRVSFDLTFSVDRSFLLYSGAVDRAASGSNSSITS